MTGLFFCHCWLHSRKVYFHGVCLLKYTWCGLHIFQNNFWTVLGQGYVSSLSHSIFTIQFPNHVNLKGIKIQLVWCLINWNKILPQYQCLAESKVLIQLLDSPLQQHNGGELSRSCLEHWQLPFVTARTWSWTPHSGFAAELPDSSQSATPWTSSYQGTPSSWLVNPGAGLWLPCWDFEKFPHLVSALLFWRLHQRHLQWDSPC